MLWAMVTVSNLRERDGVLEYLTGTVLRDIRTGFERNRRLHAFGILFATLTDGMVHELPHPVVVGLPNFTVHQIRELIARSAATTKAVGLVFAREGEFRTVERARQRSYVVVQVEHSNFPDVYWCASVQGGILGPWEGPYTGIQGPVQVKRSELLAARWMT